MEKMKVHCEHTKLVPIKDLKPHPEQTNTHPKDQIERLAKILKYQGWRYPVKVSKQSGFITTGHGRVDAARLNGWTHVPVSIQSYDDDAQEFADVQADNAIALWATMDFSKINEFMGKHGPSFDLEYLGIKNFKVDVADNGGEEDDVVPTLKKTSKVKRGMIFKLGEHRLMCGDSTAIETVEKLMGGSKADMVFTDPPYGVAYEGGHNKKKRAQIEGDSLVGKDLSALFCEALACAEAVTRDSAAFYIWYANGKAVETFAGFSTLTLKVRAVLCWYKIKSGLGAFMSQYIPNYEPCIYAHKAGKSPKWFGPSDEKTVWELKRDWRNDYHPTQKPVELVERALTNSSKPKDIILDLFGGSGATLIACEKLARRCFMMEVDPHYVDVIISRWEQFTGKKAQLIPEKGSKGRNRCST